MPILVFLNWKLGSNVGTNLLLHGVENEEREGSEDKAFEVFVRLKACVFNNSFSGSDRCDDDEDIGDDGNDPYNNVGIDDDNDGEDDGRDETCLQSTGQRARE